MRKDRRRRFRGYLKSAGVEGWKLARQFNVQAADGKLFYFSLRTRVLGYEDGRLSGSAQVEARGVVKRCDVCSAAAGRHQHYYLCPTIEC